MKFKINNREWKIKEVEQKAFWEDDNELEKMNNKDHYFGRTKVTLNEIWIDKDIPTSLKKKTLYHELIHCYRASFICFYSLDNQDEDFWCELISNSHDIIHKIVDDYFKQLDK